MNTNRVDNGKSRGRGRTPCSQASLANRQKLSTIGELNDNETESQFEIPFDEDTDQDKNCGENEKSCNFKVCFKCGKKGHLSTGKNEISFIICLVFFYYEYFKYRRLCSEIVFINKKNLRIK
jgi:hypothetical protein